MALSIGQKKNVDMTKGEILPILISFSLPLILGDIFQQFYNLTDTWVIGNFADNNEYAAMGATTFIVNMIIKSFIGISSGAGVVIGKYFGAGDKHMVKKSAQTAAVIAMVCAVLFSTVGVLITPAALRMTKAPAAVFPYAKKYLRIIFSFATVQIIYNMGAAILRAVGDSKKPFLFLMAAAATNIVLDLIFVIVFHWGIVGVAVATVISQTISAALVIIELFKTDLDVKLSTHDWEPDGSIAKSMVKIGLPTALQMCIVSFANNFVQSYVNDLGVDCMSGFATYHKVEELMFTSSNSLSITAMTFVSQNLGAGNIERAHEGVKKSLLLTTVYLLSMSALVFIFAPQVSAFFNDDPNVLRYSISMLRFITPLVFLSGLAHVTMGSIRGSGRSTAPFIVHVFSNVVFRVSYLFLVTRFIAHTAISVASCYPAGWIINVGLMLLLYKNTDFEKSSIYVKSSKAAENG